MDWILIAAVTLLICFGLAEIYSVALGRGGADLMNFKKQLLFIGIGYGLMFFLAFFDYHILRSYSSFFFVSGLAVLVAVLFFGTVINGTKGWFYIFGFGIQPVEFIKLILIIFLARYFSAANMRGQAVKHLVLTGLGTLAFFSLIILQPDFGSGMLLFVLWLMIVIWAGLEKRYLLSLAAIVLVVFSLAWAFYFHDYQKQRILTFVNPSFNALDQGYNVAQAIIAVGSGGLLGRGIGFGSQSQLKFLPESQTDFIFAVVSEELGFFGVSLMLFFFAVFLARCFINLKKVNNDFGVYFILGVASLIFVEMFINVGMNIGILPVIGIALPFVSYGGSSMIANLMMIGVVQSIIIRSRI
ncbi:MAG: rod shape-determining protein RodA [bacterium]